MSVWYEMVNDNHSNDDDEKDPHHSRPFVFWSRYSVSNNVSILIETCVPTTVALTVTSRPNENDIGSLISHSFDSSWMFNNEVEAFTIPSNKQNTSSLWSKVQVRGRPKLLIFRNQPSKEEATPFLTKRISQSHEKTDSSSHVANTYGSLTVVA